MSQPTDNSNVEIDRSEMQDLVARFKQTWQSGVPPNIVMFVHKFGRDDAFRRQLILELIAVDLEERWRWMSSQEANTLNVDGDSDDPSGRRSLPQLPRLEDYLTKFPHLLTVQGLPITLIQQEYRVRQKWGDAPPRNEYLARFARSHPNLAEALDEVDALMAPDDERTGNRKTRASQSDTSRSNESSAKSDAEDSRPASDRREMLGWQIGRYRLMQHLGSGGFADVFLALDEDLQRNVAIKVAHARMCESQQQVAEYMTEARTIAKLDHPAIVPIYDIGTTGDARFYFVSKYFEGGSLAGRMKTESLDPGEAARLIARVADGLHHAHMQGLVHRDIKPDNILLDHNDNPFVADFGLAVHEDDLRSRAGKVAGTIPYMSPEQVRGDSHAFDGRLDVWALGVVLYELLVHKRPFRGKTTDDVMSSIVRAEAKPLRQINDTIPAALERITLKCLSKNLSARYLTCRDLADDLDAWLETISDGSGRFDVRSSPITRRPQSTGGSSRTASLPDTRRQTREQSSELDLGTAETVDQPSRESHTSVSRAAGILRRSWQARLAALVLTGVLPNAFLSILVLVFFNVALGYELASIVPLIVNSVCYICAISIGIAIGWRVIWRPDTAPQAEADKSFSQCLLMPFWMAIVTFLLWFVGAGMVAKFGQGDQPVKLYMSFIGSNFVGGASAAPLVFYFMSSVSLSVMDPRRVSRKAKFQLAVISRAADIYKYVLGISPALLTLVMFLGYEKTENSSLLRYVIIASIGFIVAGFLTVFQLAPKIKARITAFDSLPVSDASSK